MLLLGVCALTSPLTKAALTADSVRTGLRTASLRTSASTTLSVETPLETCRWKLRFYKVQKVRYLLLQPLLRALQQSAVSVSTDLSTIQKSTVSLVNRPVNRALLTIQKMPVCVDTGWIPAIQIPAFGGI